MAAASHPSQSACALGVGLEERDWFDRLQRKAGCFKEWFEFVGDKLPTGVRDEFEALKQRLAASD